MTVTEAELDPDWWSLASWLSRQGSRRDVVGELSRAHPDGRISSATAVKRSWAASRAIDEWKIWYSETFPTSAQAQAGRQEAQRLVATLHSAAASRSEPIEEVDLRAGFEILAGLVGELLEVVETTVTVLHPDRQWRPNRTLDRIGERLRRLRIR